MIERRISAVYKQSTRIVSDDPGVKQESQLEEDRRRREPLQESQAPMIGNL
jgi:hypothetical protein